MTIKQVMKPFICSVITLVLLVWALVLSKTGAACCSFTSGAFAVLTLHSWNNP